MNYLILFVGIVALGHQENNQFYIWSRRHCENQTDIWFWRDGGKAYTTFLEDADKVSSEYKVHFKVLTTKRQISYAWRLDKYRNLDFLIPCNKIEILGLKRTIITNI